MAGLPADEGQAAPAGKAELLARVSSEWAALEEAIGELGEAELTAPGGEGWSVKDHLAHITTWERILLVAHLQGRPFGEAAGMDEDRSKATRHMTAETGLNDFFFDRDRGRPLPDVLADLRETHGRLVNALEAEEAAVLLEASLLEHITGNTYEHYREHGDTIQTMTSARTS